MHLLWIVSFLCAVVVTASQQGAGQQGRGQGLGHGQGVGLDGDSDPTGSCSCSGGLSVNFQCDLLEEKLNDVVAAISAQTAGPEWKLVFKAVKGVASPGETDPYLNDPYAVWDRQAPMNEAVPGANQLDTSFQGHYKSSFALNWGKRNIVEVKLAFLDSTGTELMTMVFDGAGSDHNNWFSKSRLLSSPYDDLFVESQNFFAAVGDVNHGRRWFVSRNYGGCPNDIGWVIVVGKNPPPCAWESPAGPKPNFIYSTKKTHVNWNTVGDVAEADLLAIFVRTKSRFI